ncbi:MAG: endonuclease/exonuclease/phosphatase family protein [Rhodospirillales bacterium]|nr:endonuclease/exonuclease/phosphatase family protein [Rhodospirillales bacterium]
MLDDVRTTRPSTFRLSALTLNTWNCQGDYRKRLGAMARGLAPLAPDIVLLQEVFSNRGGSDNTARFLAGEMNLAYAYHPARTKTRRLDDEQVLCSSGLAILSRHPIVWSERFVLPGDPRDGERIAQFTEIHIDRVRLLIVNLHLSHLEFADNLRRRQLDCIVGRMASAWDHDHILLGGDFNAPADAALFEIFADYPALSAARAPTAVPIGLGVDHLFAVRRREAAPLLLSPASATLDEVDEQSGVLASDHAGVQAWVTLSAPAA